LRSSDSAPASAATPSSPGMPRVWCPYLILRAGPVKQSAQRSVDALSRVSPAPRRQDLRLQVQRHPPPARSPAPDQLPQLDLADPRRSPGLRPGDPLPPRLWLVTWTATKLSRE